MLAQRESNLTKFHSTVVKVDKNVSLLRNVENRIVKLKERARKIVQQFVEILCDSDCFSSEFLFNPNSQIFSIYLVNDFQITW